MKRINNSNYEALKMLTLCDIFLKITPAALLFSAYI